MTTHYFSKINMSSSKNIKRTCLENSSLKMRIEITSDLFILFFSRVGGEDAGGGTWLYTVGIWYRSQMMNMNVSREEVLHDDI